MGEEPSSDETEKASESQSDARGGADADPDTAPDTEAETESAEEPSGSTAERDTDQFEDTVPSDETTTESTAEGTEPATGSDDIPPPQTDPNTSFAGTGPAYQDPKEYLLEDDEGGESEDDAADYDLDAEAESGESPSGEMSAEEELTPHLDQAAPGYDADGTMDGTDFGPEGPAEDQEMPLTVHLEEMIKRLAVVVAIAGIVSLATFPFAERIINFLWYSILPGTEVARPRLYGILELKLTELKTASLAGLIVALPVFVYQTYRFMRPGLYPHERRYYLAAVPTSLILALIGVGFAFFIVLPGIFTYFLYYSQDVAQIGFALGRTFDLILLLMGYLALVFQIPLFVMLAIMMGLTTREWLAQRRLLIWGSFLGISFIFSPDPTGMAPIVIALTMVVLFEGTLLLVGWTQRRSRATGT
ncbi:MAG: twin-arginine translocase subunit TatC [Halobacteriales archaeon]|nr:twin-arginine translocase subunit TatC [Halobacteriales archaeon]